MVVSSPKTKSGQRKLSEVARHIRQPEGIVSTGWPAVRDRLAQFRIPFDLWQQGAGRLILAKREDGLYAAGVGGVIISIPRQVGKTYKIGWIVFALCSIFPGMTVIWTAHHTRTSNETFGKMRAMSRKPNVKPYIESVRAANGEQAIGFTNGSRILFGARDQGFGLGFDKVDILVLDEGQRVKEVAMADMVPATNAAPNGLVIMMGTPPRPTDTGDVFAARRKDALSGDPDTLYIELSADPGAKIIDWDQVAKANPSYPHRTGKNAILRMQKLLGSDEGFYREGYGIWDEEDTGSGVFKMADWKNCPPLEDMVSPVVLGLEVSLDRQRAWLLAVGSNAAGQPQVEMVPTVQGGDAFEFEGTTDVPARIAAVIAANPDIVGISVDKFGEAASLVPLIVKAIEKLDGGKQRLRKLNIEQLGGPQWVESGGRVQDSIRDHQFGHGESPLLFAAVRVADMSSRDGVRVFKRDKSGVGAGPFFALLCGWWGWQLAGKPRARPDIF